MINGFSLRKKTSLIDISTTTTFNWRYKVMETTKNYNSKRKLQENIQMDETYFILNMKRSKTLLRKKKDIRKVVKNVELIINMFAF